MNMMSLVKVGKTVGTVAGFSVPGLLVKVGVSIAVSIVADLAAKKIAETIEKNRVA